MVLYLKYIMNFLLFFRLRSEIEKVKILKSVSIFRDIYVHISLKCMNLSIFTLHSSQFLFRETYNFRFKDSKIEILTQTFNNMCSKFLYICG